MNFQNKFLLISTAFFFSGCASHQTVSASGDGAHERTPSSASISYSGYNGKCPNLVGTWNCEGGYKIVFQTSANDPYYLNYSGDVWRVTGNKETVDKNAQPLVQQITCSVANVSGASVNVMSRSYSVDGITPAPELYSIRKDKPDTLNAMGTLCQRGQ